MTYEYTGPAVPAPTAQSTEEDWARWWQYQTALFRAAESASQELGRTTHRQTTAMLAAPVDFDARVRAMAQQIKAQNPSMDDSEIVMAAKQFQRRMDFILGAPQ